ncbi:CDP-alcohol phosphatidyltransferase family protein [Rhizobium sp. L43]|uniref:CDP-alcohol phosphatidyltransferase family protein n=1 Tax=Rhizobium sp. L43 TaxID=2035452 RepID=UPI0024782E75|nr:CDP-alcohol phosphatidyltransferase family protein [Rhizobium sp. L43]
MPFPSRLLLLGYGYAGPAPVLYLIASMTDLVDGWLARPTKRASEYRARLDAIVDNIFSVAILLFLLSSYPGLASRHGVALAVLFGGPVIYLLVSWLLTRRLLMFHFWSAKAGALLLFAFWPLLCLTEWEALIPLAATVVGLSRLEQVIFILRGGVDQDAPHMFAAVERPHFRG